MDISYKQKVKKTARHSMIKKSRGITHARKKFIVLC